jgi:hypothetical protein
LVAAAAAAGAFVSSARVEQMLKAVVAIKASVKRIRFMFFLD